MIYLISDIHGELNFKGLIQYVEKATENDLLLILGDVCLRFEDTEENRSLTEFFLSIKKNIAVVDGNHENFEFIKSFPEEDWCGGRVHRLSEHIVHLMRGNVFEIGEKSFFVFGGCKSSSRWKDMGLYHPGDEPEAEELAFVIFSKPESPIYDLKTHPGLRLTELTYADFSQTYDGVVANIPANNNDYLYLSETYYGGRLTNYNYIIIGNYKDQSDTTLLGELMRAHLSSAPRDEINFLRSQVKPNAYGMIMAGFEDKFGLIPPAEHLQTYNAVLFPDW